MGRSGWRPRDVGAELHRTLRSRWRELHDPEAVVEGEVGVEPPAEAGVERLGAIGVGHGDDDRLQLEIGRFAARRSASVHRRCSSGSPLSGHEGIVPNALHLKHPSHSGFDVVPAHGGRMAMHGCTSQPFRPAREQLEFLWSRTRAEDGRPDPQGQRLIPMLLPSVYRIGSSNVSTRN